MGTSENFKMRLKGQGASLAKQKVSVLISSKSGHGDLLTGRTWEAGLGKQGIGDAKGVVLGVSAADIDAQVLLACAQWLCLTIHCDHLLASRREGAKARVHCEHAECEASLQKESQERLMSNSLTWSIPSKEYITSWPPARPKPPVPGKGGMTPLPKGTLR